MTVSSWSKKIDGFAAGSPFSKRVWKAMLRIPRGKVSTYGAIARAVGKPRGSRAVGNACNTNPFAPDVPCHRIVAANGGLGGYAHGSARKIELLSAEGVKVRTGKIENFDKIFHDFR